MARCRSQSGTILPMPRSGSDRSSATRCPVGISGPAIWGIGSSSGSGNVAGEPQQGDALQVDDVDPDGDPGQSLGDLDDALGSVSIGSSNSSTVVGTRSSGSGPVRCLPAAACAAASSRSAASSARAAAEPVSRPIAPRSAQRAASGASRTPASRVGAGSYFGLR